MDSRKIIRRAFPSDYHLNFIIYGQNYDFDLLKLFFGKDDYRE